MDNFDHQLSSPSDVTEVMHQLGISTSLVHSPARRILHTVAANCGQVMVQMRSMRLPECQATAKLNASTPTRERRLHFFRCSDSDRTLIGYCDLRRDGTVAWAMLPETLAARRPHLYSRVVCQCNETVPLNVLGRQPQTVRGFPFSQKDQNRIKCGHAALACVTHYWSTQDRSVTALYGSDIVQLRRKVRSRNQASTDTGGTELSPELCSRLLQEIKIPNWNFDFHKGRPSRDDVTLEDLRKMKEQDLAELCETSGPGALESYKAKKREELNALREEERRDKLFRENEQRTRKCTLLYSHVESGLPVIAFVRLPSREPLHALNIIGHTFDRNDWGAVTDRSFRTHFDSPYFPDFLANTRWIGNFIIHDDNAGPYHFIDCARLARIMVGAIALVPPGMSVAPMAAEVYGLKNLMGIVTDLQLTSQVSGLQFKQYYDEFTNRLAQKRLVTRTYLLSRDRLLGMQWARAISGYLRQYGTSAEQLSTLCDCEWFWVIELSCPELYCYERKCYGHIVVKASGNQRKPLSLIHIPQFLRLGMAVTKEPLAIKYCDEPVDCFIP